MRGSVAGATPLVGPVPESLFILLPHEVQT